MVSNKLDHTQVSFSCLNFNKFGICLRIFNRYYFEYETYNKDSTFKSNVLPE